VPQDAIHKGEAVLLRSSEESQGDELPIRPLFPPSPSERGRGEGLIEPRRALAELMLLYAKMRTAIASLPPWRGKIRTGGGGEGACGWMTAPAF
jgi:hypothetical protein